MLMIGEDICKGFVIMFSSSIDGSTMTKEEISSSNNTDTGKYDCDLSYKYKLTLSTELKVSPEYWHQHESNI